MHDQAGNRMSPPTSLQRGTGFHHLVADEYRLIAQVLTYCHAAGYAIPPLLVIDYVIALKTSPFVLLFGPTGQGKTELARLFAQALVHPFEDQYTYVNLGSSLQAPEIQDRFGWMKFVETLENAAAPANAGRLFFLCLDNLRPHDVYTYFANVSRDADGMTRLVMRGYPPDKWPALPSNVIITGTLDAEHPVDSDQSALLAQINCVYMQPQWLQSNIRTVKRQQRMAPVGMQRLLLEQQYRSDEAASERLNALLGPHLDDILQPPSELMAILWQSNLTYTQIWRSTMLRAVANSFTIEGHGLFIPYDVLNNAQFAYSFVMARQLLLRLWGQPQHSAAIEALLHRQLAQLPSTTLVGLTDSLLY